MEKKNGSSSHKAFDVWTKRSFPAVWGTSIARTAEEIMKAEVIIFHRLEFYAAFGAEF